jgi:hypothetical protein
MPKRMASFALSELGYQLLPLAIRRSTIPTGSAESSAN